MRNISENQAIGLLNNESVIFLDVRSTEEYKEGHLPKAKSMPLDILERNLATLKAYKDKNIVVYCGTGSRSFRASSILSRNGFKNIYNLAMGVKPLKDYLVK
ncbi:MAG: rhodanese-like domain-containing protein [Clostridium sp.]